MLGFGLFIARIREGKRDWDDEVSVRWSVKYVEGGDWRLR
jgi:hypothetical protein